MMYLNDNEIFLDNNKKNYCIEKHKVYGVSSTYLLKIKEVWKII